MTRENKMWICFVFLVSFDITFYENCMSLQETIDSILQFRQSLKITDLCIDEITSHIATN